MGLAFLLVLLGLGCLFLAYREQESFQAIKVKGEALQKLVVQETGSQEADPMERTERNYDREPGKRTNGRAGETLDVLSSRKDVSISKSVFVTE